MTILLVRHGETVDNASHTFQMPNSPLSKNGNDQAKALAERLSSFNISNILCSDYLRTKETAAYASHQLEAELNYSELLRERHFGDIRGRPYAELDFDPFALEYQPVNGENWARFNERVTKAWEYITAVSDSARGDVLVVTHGFVCHSIVANHVLLDDGVEAPIRWGNTSLTKIDGKQPWLVSILNCVAHIEDSGESLGQV